MASGRILTTGAGLFAAGLIALGAAACSEEALGPGDGKARVQIRITDKPSDYIATAEIWVSRVYLQPRDGDNGGERFYLFDDPENPRYYDLLKLRDGITADLTEVVDVDPGSYAQLRLIVDSARVSLVDGLAFRDGTTSRRLFVPSGARTGIKVQLAEPIEAEEGATTVVLIDFDVDRNFVFQGNFNTPAGVMGVIFTPTVVEKRRSVEENG
jgi:hypothetical protein